MTKNFARRRVFFGRHGNEQEIDWDRHEREKSCDGLPLPPHYPPTERHEAPEAEQSLIEPFGQSVRNRDRASFLELLDEDWFAPRAHPASIEENGFILTHRFAASHPSYGVNANSL